MLRDALRDPIITQHILETPLLDEFFGYVQVRCTLHLTSIALFCSTVVMVCQPHLTTAVFHNPCSIQPASVL